MVDYEQLLSELGSNAFTELRPAQRETLHLYSEVDLSARDLALELPTGAGKSLIALLIAENSRRQSNKVAILTGNKTLARQLAGEAELLGIPIVLMEGAGREISANAKRQYHRSRAVAIMNYWVYFNQNPVIDPADLLIMDDAHLAEHCLHSLYSVEIDRFEHKNLFKSVVTNLAVRCPDNALLQDALDDNAIPNQSAELLSFIDQIALAAGIRDVIDAADETQSNADLRFRWARLRDRVGEANLYISSRSLWLRPYIYPLTANPHYMAPSQRIYMSATIGDPADLARRLGTQSVTKLPIPAQYTQTTYGRRLIVMNRIEDEDIPPRLSHVIFAALQIQPKSVWLCSSVAEAEKYQKAVIDWLAKNGMKGHPTWLLSNLGDEIEAFKSSAAGHLFVGGRFDGMDFLADECRLVVLATVPRAVNLQEEFFCAYLRDADFMLRRLNQRILQALGRCNRSPDDYGVYVLADRRFATHFGRESNRLGLPGNIRAEIDMAEDATELGIEELTEEVRGFLSGDFTRYDGELKAAAQSTPEAKVGLQLPDTSASEVEGWVELFQNQDYLAAAKHFAVASEAASKPEFREIGAFYSWSEAKAKFLAGKQGFPGAESDALGFLEHSIALGGQSSWFNRQRASINRYRAGNEQLQVPMDDHPLAIAQALNDHLERVGKTGLGFEKWATGLAGKLSSTSHDSFASGLEELGRLLGFTATRPKHQAATDCRWKGTFGNTKELVTFEAKIEHVNTSQIAPKDVGQAHNQIEQAKKEASHLGYTVRGCIVTHLTDIEPAAVSGLGDVRIVPRTAVLLLFDRVMQVARGYRERWFPGDLDARRLATDFVVANAPTAGWMTRALSVDAVFLEPDGLVIEWANSTSG